MSNNSLHKAKKAKNDEWYTLRDDVESYNKRIENCIKANIDLSPRAIKDKLGLDKPIYSKTANGGHFGRDFTWEELDIKDLFKNI